jgi:hypothetical protein
VKRIHDSLQHVFQRHRLVFWYDPTGEWAETFSAYPDENVAQLKNRLVLLTQEQATASTAKAKTDARKEADKLTKILAECEEWERQTMLPLAQARIELDLDDGVKTNYLKLGEALAPIAGLATKED